MASTTRRERALLIVLAILAIGLPFLAHAAGQAYFITIASRVLIYGLAAMSLDLILGYGGMASFGHAAFFGLGGYVVAILLVQDATVPVLPGGDTALVAWCAALVVSAFAGLVIGALSLRTSGAHFIMVTLAFAQMIYFLFDSLTAYGGDDGIALRRRNLLPAGLDARDPVVFYFVCLGILVAALALARRIVDSRFGMVIRAGRQNERRLVALGVTPYPYRVVCFAFAASLAGLAGALLANHDRFVSPEMLHWTKSGELMAMVILGGSGTLFGPVIGAAALLLLEAALAAVTEHWMVVLGPLLVLIILFARRGLWGVLAGCADRG